MSTITIDGVQYQGNIVISSNTSVPPDLYIQSEVNGYTITRIYESVFNSNTNLIKITLPGSINNINSLDGTAGPSGGSRYCHQFSGCSNLEYADLSKTSITVLGAQCFANCYKLKDVYLPDSLREAQHMSFYFCGSQVGTTINLGSSIVELSGGNSYFGGANIDNLISRSTSNNLYYKYNNIDTAEALRGINHTSANISNWIELPILSSFTMSSTNLSSGNATINMTFSNSEITQNDISNNLYVEPASAGTFSSIINTFGTEWTAIFTPNYGEFLSDCSLNFKYRHYGIDETIHFNIIEPPPTLNIFTIIPSNITFENHGTINMTFSDDVTYTDISNSLTVDPSNAGKIENITGPGINWTAVFIPDYGLDLTNCRLNFNHSTYGINEYSNTFNIDTTFEILDFSLTPSNLIDTDVSAILRIEFDKTVSSSSNFNITLDPSYIATLGTMSVVNGGFVWEGVLTRTPNMNKLGNKLDFDFSYNGVEVSANLVFDVVENSQLINKNWALSSSNTINKVFKNTLQMSPNGSLMGFINGANVEIYRKSENWIPDVSFVGHKFALTNNHIAIASDASLQIYDYSGNGWNIMNGGNIAYLNVVALSINLDGNVVAVSDNSYVKLFKNISNNWTHINTHIEASVNGLSLSPNGLKLGMGIGNAGEDFSSIVVEDIVVVVDTTPPVITLDGSATMTIEVGTLWFEPGYTATDNFDGDISNKVVTTGIVDVDSTGEYTLQYDVSDNAGNPALQVTRTVNVVYTPILVWSEPDTNIFELSNFASYLSLTDPTLKQFTVSGNANAFLNGNYEYIYSSYYSKYKPIMAIDHTYIYIGMRTASNGSHPVTSHIYGTFHNADRTQYTASGSYQGSTCYAVSNNSPINIFYSHYCNSNDTTYNGEYLEWQFPFLLEPSNFKITSSKIPDISVLLGSNDSGTTWDYITTMTTQASPHDEAISTTQKYSRFKWVVTKNTKYENIWITGIKIYGDIYI